MLAGFSESRTRGDHLVMSRPGSARPVIIKMDSNLGEDIIQSNKRTMGLTTSEFEDFLDQVQGKKKKSKKKAKGEGKH
jgi:predicted RNA binding protein YcfA (HicA-like mRNA interferase family)